MKNLILTLGLLLIAALGCTAPRSSGSSSSSKAATSAPTIIYGKPSFESLGRAGSIVHIQVTNTSDKTLQFVEGHMALYDKSGDLVSSQNGYCETQTLTPGGKGVVKIMVDKDSRVSRYEMTFSAQVDGEFGDTQLTAVQK